MNILSKSYPRVQMLKDWLHDNIDDDLLKYNTMDTDSHQSFKQLLCSVYVCDNTEKYPMSASPTSCYEQRELVLTAIERALSKSGPCKNLLSYGFCLMSPDPFSHRCGVNVENRYPNSCVNKLFYPAWEILLSKIGDTVMTYLLEHTSLYLYIDTDCFVQLTGLPLFDLLKQDKNEKKKICDKVFKEVDIPRTRKTKVDGNLRSNKTDSPTVIETEQNGTQFDFHTDHTSFDKITEVTNKAEGILNRTQIECLRNIPENKTNDIVLDKTEGGANKNLFTNCATSSRSTEDTCNNNRKKKRKYEEISEQRFLDLKRESELYKMRNRQAIDCHSAGSFDDLANQDLGSKDALTGNIIDKMAKNLRKRKFSEIYSETENSEDNKSKQSCLGNGNHTQNDDIAGNIANCIVETTEEFNTIRKLPNTGINVKVKKDRSCNVLSKIKHRKRRTEKKKLKSSQEKNLGYSFCPFEFHLPLARNSALFSRNPREKLSKSVLLSRLDSTFEDAFTLCMEIFCDTKVLTKNEPQVILPDLREMKSKNSEKCKEPSHPIESGLKNSLCKKGMQGVSNDVPCVCCDNELKIRLEHVENRQCCNLCKNQKHTKQSFNEKTVKNCPCVTKTELSRICELDYENTQDKRLLNEKIKEKFSNDKCKKVSLLARRKYEVLSSRDPECSMVSEWKTLQQNEGSCSNFDLSNESGIVESDITSQYNSSMARSMRKFALPKAGNCERCSIERMATEEQIQRSNIDGETLYRTTNDTCINSSLNIHSCVLHCGQDSCTVLQEKNAQDHDPCSREAELKPGSNDMVSHNTRAIDISIVSAVVPSLKQFIENHRNCPYRALLNHHCPAEVYKTNHSGPRIRRGFLRSSRRNTASNLLRSHHHPRKVFLFLRACIMKVLPVKLIGTKHNLNVILKNISKMISLGKNDRLTLGQLMNGMKTTEVDWLRPTTSNSLRLHLLARLVLWLFTYSLTLLKTYFYITDTAFLRYKMVYYRQVTWNKLHIYGFKDLIHRKILKTVSQVWPYQSLGVSVLRFLPKQQSLRPIINMGSSVTVESHQTLSVNKQISDMHCVLTYIKNKNPSRTGYGIMGTDDIYKSWVDFVGKWNSSGSPKLYFVKADICKCYDTICQSKLYAIMEHILTKEMCDEEYIIRKYFIVGVKEGKLVRKFQREVMPLSKFNPDFSSFCAEKAKQDKLSNVVFVDKVVYQHETCETLLKALKMHLFNNLVKVGNHYCLQTSGISQGSVISTLLCSFYYAHMERNLFKITDGDFLLRLVDDYLYITPTQHKAVNFLNTMISGIPEYSCYTNKEKILTNFRWDGDGDMFPVVLTEWFPWCGMYFNTRTIETSLDFTKYSGCSMKDTVSVEQSNNPGKSLKEKILFSIRQTCHRLFIDTSINSKKQMLRNVYQIFLLAVFKLHIHIRNLPCHQADRNSRFFFGILMEMINVVRKLVRKYQQQDKRPVCSSLVTWLCLKACTVKLSRHHAQYRNLLKHLRHQLYHKQKTLTPSELNEVNEVVGTGMPEEFHNIIS
ncbi:telomerase reverse transcriptase-like [Ruditapes philippinarum]|uniref:telomerase reverse transcriptase-like n=1 Tax=Ruditapes philippinarum TaxID=129788 RepID=UPI00295B6CD8|nr:telomerase reverse transcriptase-like [Ruditapes philippinarum]